MFITFFINGNRVNSSEYNHGNNILKEMDFLISICSQFRVHKKGKKDINNSEKNFFWKILRKYIEVETGGLRHITGW